VREPPFILEIHLEFAFIRVYFAVSWWPVVVAPPPSGFLSWVNSISSSSREDSGAIAALFFLIGETAADPDFDPIRKRSAFRQVDGEDTDVSVSLDFAN
jgi:hypothetical protein